jgi:hypothetical protein
MTKTEAQALYKEIKRIDCSYPPGLQHEKNVKQMDELIKRFPGVEK